METKSNILDEIELRSEAVQEVLAEPPHWMFRWGSVIILGIIFMILLMSYFIKYPEFVPAPIIVTSLNPPEKLQARIETKIEKIFIKDHQKVSKNEVLMVLQSTANYIDILKLKNIIDTISSDELINFPVNEISKYKLGELQSDYNNFAKAFQDEKLFTTLRPYAPENVATAQNLSTYKSRMVTLNSQKKLETEKYELVKKNYQRAIQLFNQKVISTYEFENEKIKSLQAQQSLENLDISISQTEEAIFNLNKTKSGTNINTEKDKINFASQTLQLFEQLRKSLRAWEHNYLLISSTNGVASFQQFWGENQFVKNGEPILSILPDDKKVLIGRMFVAAANSGKVTRGEKVLIKLDNYRFQEYGIVTGKVQNISFTPDDRGNYYVDVLLSNGLNTSYKKTLPFDKELKGNAEIVTQDLRLIERFFYQIRKLLGY
ncbi:HlyD family secretion protein [Pedobacter punctiformis]|uniref:HlyD family efflux transporter periplasmic adaptor subunit n=1 Tax=Pedobacter punctiformis TaxID=3004097 RepID=A0ABT4LD47_9SPHI|nr:HlyD family efflux transporter periplasmic adaptor subunit [Pedobacter sp. HCMS5-2]MCZ4245847.1 HlyD family efflux transporter periplasmic adaptor subunit [Pedobacter sp. HCMS5-2]